MEGSRKRNFCGCFWSCDSSSCRSTTQFRGNYAGFWRQLTLRNDCFVCVCVCVITNVACERGHGHISCGSGWVHMKKANSHFESSCAPIWAPVPKWGTTIGMCLCRLHIYISAKSNCNCPQVVLWLKAFSRLSHGIRLLGNLRPCSDPAAQPLCQGAAALGGEPGVLAAPARWQIALSPAGENVI